MKAVCWRGLWLLCSLLLLQACRDPAPTPTATAPTPPPPTLQPTAVSIPTPSTPASQVPQPAVEPAATLPATAVPESTTVPLPSPTTFIIDQQNITTSGALWGVAELSPIGQTFVPTADMLSVVALWVSTGGPEPVTLQVVMHQGGLDGPVLGRSQPAEIPLDFEDVVSFTFATAVSLQPGQPHTLEIARVSAGGNGAVGWMQHAGWDDPYDQGEAIVQGQFLPFTDLWFQTGR